MAIETAIGAAVVLAVVAGISYAGWRMQRRHDKKSKEEGKPRLSRGDKIGLAISGCVFAFIVAAFVLSAV